jgi:hypothetical protein
VVLQLPQVWQACLLPHFNLSLKASRPLRALTGTHQQYCTHKSKSECTMLAAGCAAPQTIRQVVLHMIATTRQA